jgi:hypothetical protein
VVDAGKSKALTANIPKQWFEVHRYTISPLIVWSTVRLSSLWKHFISVIFLVYAIGEIEQSGVGRTSS